MFYDLYLVDTYLQITEQEAIINSFSCFWQLLHSPLIGAFTSYFTAKYP